MGKKIVICVLVVFLFNSCSKPKTGSYVLELNGFITVPTVGSNTFSRVYDYEITRSGMTSLNIKQDCPQYYSTTYSILSKKGRKVWGTLLYFWGDATGSRSEKLYIEGRIVSGTHGDVIKGTFTGDLDMSSGSSQAYKDYYKGDFTFRPK